MSNTYFNQLETVLNSANFVYVADLTALNGSGVEATAFLAVEGTTLTVATVARGVTPDQLHIQHIHGRFDDAGNPIDSAAPTLFDDTDGDGYVEVLEGLAAYGDVLLSLENLNDGTHNDPVANSAGEMLTINSYDLTDDDNFFSTVTGTEFTAADLMPLPLREIVIHGAEVPEGAGAGTDGAIDGTGGFKATLPVAAGSIEGSSLEGALAKLAILGGGDRLTEGDGAVADPVGGIAYGDDASANGADAVAIGDEANASGASTTAVGGESDALGVAATAFGWRASAEGERAHAFGHLADADGDFSLAIGEAASAASDNATAIGNAASADGRDALAIGDSATATGGPSTTAVGGESTANGVAATAFGWRASAEGERAHAFGHLADAEGDFTLAIGEAASAVGDYATAIGNQVSADAFEIAVGGGDATYTLAGLSGDGGILMVDAEGRLSLDAIAGFGIDADDSPMTTAPTVSTPTAAMAADPRPQDEMSAPTSEGASTANGVGAISVGNGATADGRDALVIGDAASATGGPSTTAVGGEANATGTAATVFGWRGSAEGERAHALGHIASADGDFSLAVGEAANATGDNTTAIGNAASAMGVDALSIGDSAMVNGTSTTGVGGEITVDGIAATAFGWKASATGERAHALGHIAKADGDFTLAVGEAASATGTNAVAIGSNVIADEANEFALGLSEHSYIFSGLGSDVGVSGWQLVGVDANGTLAIASFGGGMDSLAGSASAPTSAMQAMSMPANRVSLGDGETTETTGTITLGNGAGATGRDAIAIGDQALANGTSTTAVGGESTANGTAATAFGWRSLAEGERAHALGHIATAQGDFTLALGEAAMAGTDNATAIGNGANAAGVDALAIGDMAHSAGTSTTAVGGESSAMGTAATAFGWRASAEGERAHAFGHLADASGDRSLAVGEAATAEGARGIAIGSNVTATGDDAVALGNDMHDYIFAGLGTNVSEGTKAVAVDQEGLLMSVNVLTASGAVTNGGDDADLIIGTMAAETLNGLGGNDKFIGQGGGDMIDGGGGTDIVEYQLARTDIMQTLNEDGSISVNSATGVDTLVDVERISLEDGAFIFDLEGEDAASVYRLYDLFERSPDEAGLRFWSGVADTTGDLDFIVENFISGSEYADTYGGTGTLEFLDLLYMNVLDRESDQAGVDFWSGAINSGAVDRSDVILDFTDSVENAADHAAVTDDGLFVV